MRLPLAIGLFVVGVILLVWGLNAGESFASDISRLFTGQPTDRTIWLTVGGILAIVGGIAVMAMPSRMLNK